MAKIVLSGSGFLDISNPDIADLYANSTSLYHNNTATVLDSGDINLLFQGTGFTSFDSHGFAKAGTITKASVFFPGEGRVDWTGLSLDAGNFEHAIKAGNTAAFIDALWGGDDKIVLNIGGAEVNGFGGNDTIIGKAGFDVLLGGEGNDILRGGDGGDSLEGGAGRDTLTGGTTGGGDIFHFRAAADSTVGSIDTITDLQDGDTIDLQDIDANGAEAGEGAFSIVASFSGTAGEMTITFDAGHNRTAIKGDINGDGSIDASDLVIYVSGDHTSFSNFDF